MKTTLKTKPLLAAVTALNKVIPAKPINPILENIFMETSPGTLRLVATDLETTLEVNIPENDATGCSVEDGGKACLPARFLLEILKQIDSETVSLETPDERSMTVVWTNGRSQLPTIDTEDYPAVDLTVADGVETTFAAEVLAKALAATAYACAEDEVRPAMNGVLFDLSNTGLALVASDSHRLIVEDIPEVTADTQTQFILFRRHANLLKGLCTEGETVSVRMSATNAVFRFADMTLAVRGCTGRYPRYRDVIPKNNTNVLTTDRKGLVAILRRISVCANRVSQHIKVELVTEATGSTMKLTAEDLGFGLNAYEEMPIDYDGENMSIGFKASFLVEILSNIEGENVRISLSDCRRAVLITPAEEQESPATTAILMPVMV
jgi:DNA polymerase III, beta subunit